MVSIFTYGFPQAEEAFKIAGVTNISLTNYEALAQLAIQKNIIEESQLKTLLNWRSDPENWNG
jgi:orotate phosphoribosyltransferase